MHGQKDDFDARIVLLQLRERVDPVQMGLFHDLRQAMFRQLSFESASSFESGLTDRRTV